MTEVNPLNMHTDGGGQAGPLNMHTDGGGEADPFNMHTDSAGTVTPFNMHTDMVVGSGANGSLHLSAKNATGVPLALTITPGIAGKLGAVLGLGGPPAANPHAPAPVAPFNMHTDAHTTVNANAAVSRATLEGPAEGPHGHVKLKVTIDGPALATVKGSHAGI
jgi:hypothetical protein